MSKHSARELHEVTEIERSPEALREAQERFLSARFLPTSDTSGLMPKRSTRVVMDVTAIFAAVTVMLLAASYFDALETFQRWAQNYERWEIDELVFVPVVLAIAFGAYYWRRSAELQRAAHERKRVEEVLRKSEERFRALVQNASDMVLVLGGDGAVRYISPAVEMVLGHEPEDVIRQGAFNIVGTGYSSLSYLKRFPIDILKIDRSFVQRLRRDPEDAVIVSGIITLAHTLGMKVVAEGVESAEQLAQLRGLGCDLAQGNYFSEALPAEAASALLASDPHW